MATTFALSNLTSFFNPVFSITLFFIVSLLRLNSFDNSDAILSSLTPIDILLCASISLHLRIFVDVDMSV